MIINIMKNMKQQIHVNALHLHVLLRELELELELDILLVNISFIHMKILFEIGIYMIDG